MRFIVFILSLLISITVSSQSIRDMEKALRKHRQASAIFSDDAFTKTRVLNANYKYLQDFGITTYAAGFNDDFQADGYTLTKPVYTIDLYTLHDTVFVTKMNKVIYNPDSTAAKPEITSLVFKTDTALLLRFIAMHNKKYHSYWTIDDFFKEPSEYGSFTFFCGYAPSPREGAYALCKLVKEKNLWALKALASSFHPNERAFGTAGLFFLQLQGEKLTADLIALMRLNQQSTIVLSYCHGCIFDAKPMCELLEYEKLYYLHKLLVEYQLL